VKDTLGHTSTPAFSVESELLRYFPGHTDAFQIWYAVYPVLLCSSRLFLCNAYISEIQFVHVQFIYTAFSFIHSLFDSNHKNPQ